MKDLNNKRRKTITNKTHIRNHQKTKEGKWSRAGKQILKKNFSKWNAIQLLPTKHTKKWHLKKRYPNDKYMITALRNQELEQSVPPSAAVLHKLKGICY